MGKRHSRRQDVCILTEDNGVYDIRLEAGIIHAESTNDALAWLIDSTQQARDEKTGKWIQVIGDLSYMPLIIYDELRETLGILDKKVSNISSQTEDEEMTFLDRRKSKDGRLLWLGICLAMVTLTVCILVLLRIKAH